MPSSFTILIASISYKLPFLAKYTVPMTNLKKSISQYDFLNLIRLIRDIVICKVFINSRVRKVRYPYFIIGKKNIEFGKGFTAGVNLRVEVLKTSHHSRPVLSFGNDVKLNDSVHIACVKKVKLGNNVLVGSQVIITDHNHGVYSGTELPHDHPGTPPDERQLSSAPVEIHDNVWIGDFVAVLKGSIIGEGCIIGAMSVVNGYIPPYSIAVGSPAKVVKMFNFETACWEKI